MRITSREKLLLIGLVIFLVGWVVFDYVIEDQLQKISDAEIELRLKQNEKAEYEKLIAMEPNIDKSIEESYNIIEETATNYFNTTPQEELILLFNDFLLMPFVDESTIKFSKMQSTKINKIPFAKQNIVLEFNGQYTSFVNMLKTIWAFPKSINVTQLSMESAGYDEVSGKVVFELYTFLVESDVVDNLYQWYIDELFFKENPFARFEESDIVVRYLFLNDDDELFNYSKFFEFIDIEEHWLEEEIREFLELGYLYLNPTLEFGPDEPMTRGEFIVLVDSVYDWPIEDAEADLTDFRDYEDLGSLESSFAKAIHRGYLSGYVEGFTDNTLRPRDPISYLEVEFLMNKIKGTQGFTWEQVASALGNKQGSFDNTWYTDTGKLTRAEAVYLLYYFK